MCCYSMRCMAKDCIFTPSSPLLCFRTGFSRFINCSVHVICVENHTAMSRKVRCLGALHWWADHENTSRESRRSEWYQICKTCPFLNLRYLRESLWELPVPKLNLDVWERKPRFTRYSFNIRDHKGSNLRYVILLLGTCNEHVMTSTMWFIVTQLDPLVGGHFAFQRDMFAPSNIYQELLGTQVWSLHCPSFEQM